MPIIVLYDKNKLKPIPLNIFKGIIPSKSLAPVCLGSKGAKLLTYMPGW